MTIEIRNETTAVVDEREFVELSRFVFEAMHLHPATEMSIIFVDEEAMEKLHVQWLDLPGPTDVMSFPMDEVGGQAVLGRQESLTTPWLTERNG